LLDELFLDLIDKIKHLEVFLKACDLGAKMSGFEDMFCGEIVVMGERTRAFFYKVVLVIIEVELNEALEKLLTLFFIKGGVVLFKPLKIVVSDLHFAVVEAFCGYRSNSIFICLKRFFLVYGVLVVEG